MSLEPCRSCGRPIAAGARVCPHCGEFYGIVRRDRGMDILLSSCGCTLLMFFAIFVMWLFTELFGLAD